MQPDVGSGGIPVPLEKTPLEAYVPPKRPSLIGLSRGEIAAHLAEIGVAAAQRKMRAQQLWHWMYFRGAKNFDEMTSISKDTRAELAQHFTVDRPEVVAEHHKRLEDWQAKLAHAQKALAVINGWIAAKKIRAPELVMENGSGLSRIERISAGNLAALLQAAWRSAVMPEFIASMPVVAVDGTMRRRLTGEGVAGQAHIKTGLLSEVRAMAGYVLDSGGRRFVVVMLVNHPRAHDAQPAMDALLRWVYER